MAENSTGVFMKNNAPGQKMTDLLTLLVQAYDGPLSDSTLSFLEFCRNYLKVHRPSEILTVPYNIGIRLTNGQDIQVFPDSESATFGDGSMANPDNSISINRQ